jgi:hypothetical protein
VPLRRLSREEYRNTVLDLLGVDVNLVGKSVELPEDVIRHGFSNLADAQHLSAGTLEKYMEVADRVVESARLASLKPPTVLQRWSAESAEPWGVKVPGGRVRFGGTLFVNLPNSRSQILTQQAEGWYRLRFSARTHESDKPLRICVVVGNSFAREIIDYADVPAKSTVFEFRAWMRRKTYCTVAGTWPNRTAGLKGAELENYKGPGLAIEWVEMEGPVFDAWPPPGHQQMFGDLPVRAGPGGLPVVVSSTPRADAERLLRRFVEKAFRRPVRDDELRPFLQLVINQLNTGVVFDQALLLAYKAVLSSPQFLFLLEKPGVLDDWALASRLSYFLWASMPDQALFDLARQGKLRDPDVQRTQVERLLSDPKARRFVNNFLSHWLDLRLLDFVMPDQKLYPEFDEQLQQSLAREPQLFFQELLASDFSLVNLVSSDFSMLNDRLARHYGISGVEGFGFRKVSLPPTSHRGGVLTMASVLKVTADGSATSPVVRGVWLQERVFGNQVPPPPEDAAPLDDDPSGKTTIRERLARHRQNACAVCHKSIDPPGFALESFDPIGLWRDRYRTLGQGQVVKSMPYRLGPQVETGAELEDGRRFRDSDEFKQLLAGRKDQLARALADKLLTYATGRKPDLSDAKSLDQIVAKVSLRNYGLRSLVHEVIQTATFQNK